MRLPGTLGSRRPIKPDLSYYSDKTAMPEHEMSHTLQLGWDKNESIDW